METPPRSFRSASWKGPSSNSKTDSTDTKQSNQKSEGIPCAPIVDNFQTPSRYFRSASWKGPSSNSDQQSEGIPRTPTSVYRSRSINISSQHSTTMPRHPQPQPKAKSSHNIAVEKAFEQFFLACTCKSILASFHQLLDVTGLRHVDHRDFYKEIKEQLKFSWKAQSLWAKLDKRASHRDYGRGKICSNTKVLIIGAGPCGLRTAIECAFLGARTVLVEKRDRFSRNNVLHLWPYLITDLKNLGAKMFFGKFCAGAIDHISIRQLQCILMKVALLVGVEVHVNVAFDGLIEPPEDQTTKVGWRCKPDPENHPVAEYQFDVLIGADGKRNTLSGFKRKEFRGKLAIAITANFINSNSNAEARVEEISGVAFIFNQKFFLDLKERTGIDLENIVYYKDDTHYFVMTAKKQSLLDKGVLKQDYADTVSLLDRSNVEQDALLSYAHEAADFSTNQQLPNLQYAVNHYGQADVAMFDFTSMFAAVNASRVIDRQGCKLLVGLVGDSLLEPFWPTGSGCARGFLGAFDAAWMIRSWASGNMTPLEVIAERESIYSFLSQTTQDRLHKNYHHYSIDPCTRYPNLEVSRLKPKQVVQYYDGVVDPKELEEAPVEVPAKRRRNVVTSEYQIDSYNLLRWCQRVLNTDTYRGVHIVDFTSSWRSGLAFCALIHAFRPKLISTTAMLECEVAKNNQLAFDTAQKELGIAPVMTGEDMASCSVPDKLTMIAYLSQFYELFKVEPLPSSLPLQPKAKQQEKEEKIKSPSSPKTQGRTSLLGKISQRITRSKKRKEKERDDSHQGSKKLRDGQHESIEVTASNKLPMEEIANKLQVDKPAEMSMARRDSKALVDNGSVSVTARAEVLVAKFKSNEEQPAPPPIRRTKGQPMLLAAQSASEFCYFCNKRVYIMERQGAEGVFFHRHCFKCEYCGLGLRTNNYSCDRQQGEGVKFYCYRHLTPESRTRPRRKRNLDASLDSKENIPTTVITPAEETEIPVNNDPATPKKIIPAPLRLPPEPLEKAKKTPERIGFENSFDGQEEETEEEQFEHNLRASMSSDSILDNSDDDDDDDDDEDSDEEPTKAQTADSADTDSVSGRDGDIYGYVSESEVARILDEWSGTEDDIFDTATESLTASGGGSWTLAETVKLASTWKRQHSAENLLDAVEQDMQKRKQRSGDAYERLYNCRDNDEDEDEEGSSTEVEEDSDTEVDYSSADEMTEGESERTKGGGSTADTLEGGATEDSAATTATSPSSPAVKNAARASFFSAPPTVVRLDPWRMFNKDNKKEEEAAEGEPDNREERADQQALEMEESVKREDHDTDVSESIEMDSGDERGRGSSGEGSVEDLEDFDEESQRRERAMSVEGEQDVEMEAVQEDTEEIDDEDMEKTAVSLAMEQLLVDIDKTSVGGSDQAPELDNLLPSDNEDDVFQNVQSGRSARLGTGESEGTGSDDTAREEVLRSVMEMDDTTRSTTGEDTLRQVLQEVADMPELSETEKNEHFRNLDERFVTDRKRAGKKKAVEKDIGSDSDLTISTPSSESLSSSSSLNDVVQQNHRFLATGDAEDDLKPDQNMMKDYMNTMSLVLDESFSDGEQDGSLEKPDSTTPRDDMNRTLLAQDMEEGGTADGQDTNHSKEANSSSLYLTPEMSIEERRESQENFKDARESFPSAGARSPGKKMSPEVLKSATESQGGVPKGRKVADSKNQKPVSTTSQDLKVHRKLPEVPRPKVSVSAPQNSKKTAYATAKSTPSELSKRTPARSSQPSVRSRIQSSSSTTDSAKQRVAAPQSVSSRQRAASSTNSSDSSRTSVSRPLPRPGMAKRVSTTSASSDRSSSSPAPVQSTGVPSTRNKASTSGSIKPQGAKGKTVIHVDRNSLWSESSTDQLASDSESPKKKIPVDTSVVRALPVPRTPSAISDIEDIPFADESEVEDQFFTPSTSVKVKPEAVPQADSRNNVRKRILPSPPNPVGTSPNLPSAQQIHNIKQAEHAKAKLASDSRWPNKEDSNNKGAAFTNPAYGSVPGVLKRRPGVRRHDDPRDRRSSSYDTPGTPDALSDSDDSHLQADTSATPTSSTTDLDATPKGRKKKEKSKSSTASAAKVKMRKSKDFANKRKKEEKSQGEDSNKEKHRRSFLGLILPKSSDKNKDKAAASAQVVDSKPAATDKQAMKDNVEDKSKKSKTKHKRTKSGDSLDDGLTSDIRGLKITSVFSQEGGAMGDMGADRRLMRPIPLAPKASVDEYSDSDESQVSVNTLLRRRDQLSAGGMDERVTRKLQRMAAKQQKQAEQQRLRAAQEIQRCLQEVDERQMQLENRGISVEKALRGEGPEADVDENQLMGEWFNLVHEKNALVRYESELMVRAKELELEDRQARLQATFRDCTTKPDWEKTMDEIATEGQLLEELVDVVEQRNNLVAMLEEDRLREQEEDRELEDMMEKKGLVLSPLNYSRTIPPSASSSITLEASAATAT